MRNRKVKAKRKLGNGEASKIKFLDPILKNTVLKDIVAYSTSLSLRLVGWDKRYFDFWQRRGYHITPVHYYQPIPDTRELKQDLWLKDSELVGVDINEQKQLELLSLFVARFKNEYDRFPENKTSKPCKYYLNNGWFGCVDGEILYCMIRYFKPRKILEIGAGYSTYLSAEAILKNKEEDDSYECELVAIEPYPNENLKAGFLGLSKLIPKKVQDVPLSEFNKLEENDILFIDSSHILKIGSDVQYEYLEILPRLKKGVIIHVHDILFPREYLKEWVLKGYTFWNEQYLLQAFLTFNNSFEVLWAGYYIHLKHPNKLEKAFASYKRVKRPGFSFWMRKTTMELT